MNGVIHYCFICREYVEIFDSPAKCRCGEQRPLYLPVTNPTLEMLNLLMNISRHTDRLPED